MKFSEQLKNLGFVSYKEYLNSSHWYDFKKQYRAAGCRMNCVLCGITPIQLHHHTYVRLGNERLEDVTPLCRPHHIGVHEWLKSSGRNFVEFTHEAIVAMGGVMHGDSRTKVITPNHETERYWNKPKHHKNKHKKHKKNKNPRRPPLSEITIKPPCGWKNYLYKGFGYKPVH